MVTEVICGFGCCREGASVLSELGVLSAMRSVVSRFLFWLVCDSRIKLPGPLAPWLFGLAIGRRPRRIK